MQPLIIRIDIQTLTLLISVFLWTLLKSIYFKPNQFICFLALFHSRVLMFYFSTSVLVKWCIIPKSMLLFLLVYNNVCILFSCLQIIS